MGIWGFATLPCCTGSQNHSKPRKNAHFRWSLLIAWRHSLQNGTSLHILGDLVLHLMNHATYGAS
eukprot:1047907-Amphidinium_carterae.1